MTEDMALGLAFMLGLKALWSTICYYMASKRNRNPAGWAVGGFIFGVWAIITLALLGNVEATKVVTKSVTDA